ncbi:uracil-DNA glycosylase [Erysipelothrix anatis]|uniref:uracil-DNA glycosylase n=1 Tax=Erysipelothrix anatis TaxID=2683713 RepID=UPI002E2666C4
MEVSMSTWQELLQEEFEKPYFISLAQFVRERRLEVPVYPPEQDVFAAFDDTPLDTVKVVILGQDPYHQPGQAMGLSFSVHKDIPLPKSLVNMYKELERDLGIVNTHGDLSTWAKQGVFMLNTILTVEESRPLSHQKKGWETFTDTVIATLGSQDKPIVFVLWGKKAQEKKVLIKKHHIFVESSHPSPLGAYRGFNGSRPFSTINHHLEELGETPIDWSLNV